jgi:CHAT domain-containing protein
MPFARKIPLLFALAITLSVLLAQQQLSAPMEYEQKIEYYAEQGVVDSFLFYANQKIAQAKENNNLENWTGARLDVSDFYYELKQYEAASKHLDETWNAKWRQPETADEWEPFCYVQSNRGTDKAKMGNLLQAIQALESAAEMFEKFRFEDFDVVESVYKPLGNCYTRLGDNDKALAVFFKALLYTSDNETLAGLYCNIGLAYWNKGDYNAAEQYHRQGMNLPDVSALKRALLTGSLAQTQLAEGALQQAERNAAQALSLLSTAPKNPTAREYRCYALCTSGMVKNQLGHYLPAEQMLKAARSEAKAAFGMVSRDLGKIEIALASLYLKQGKYEEALEAGNRALGAVIPGFKPNSPEQNPDIRGLYEENVIFYALSLKAQAAFEWYEKFGDMNWLTHSLNCHELAWQAESKLRKIFQYNSSKLDLQTTAKEREQHAMLVVRELYEKTGQTAFLEKAFSIAERSKAALLSDALRENLIRQRLSESDPRFSSLNALQQNFSLFEKQLLLYPDSSDARHWRAESDLLLVQINNIQAEIANNYPTLSDQNFINLSAVISGLSDEETLIEYFAGTNSIELFILEKDALPLWKSIPNDSTFNHLTAKYLAYFSNQIAILNDPAGYQNTAHLLWKKLFPNGLTAGEKLIIVPDGVLNFVAFDALLTDASTGSLRNAAYLLKQKEIHYAWSCSVLNQQKKLRSKAPQYALSLAPGFSDGRRGLAPLHSPDSECPKGSKKLLDESAVLATFLAEAGHYKILHLSTHAFASATREQAPRLELHDQALFLPNIYALPLQADLVTLSACQTGIGQSLSGEGVMSLARAFAQAGAACVLSSLWSVNDKSTSQLLTHFYRKVENGIPVGQSLRAAKLQYLTDAEVSANMQSPYFWAGFAMVGDDRILGKPGQAGWWLLALGGAFVLIWVLRRRMKKI